MKVASQQITLRNLINGRSPLANLQRAVEDALGPDTTPVRLSVTGKFRGEHRCEVEAVYPRIYGSERGRDLDLRLPPTHGSLAPTRSTP